MIRLILISLFISASIASSETLLNGPMISDLSFREAQVWIQTKTPTSLRIQYASENNPADTYYTQEIHTNEANACTANFTLSKVEPSNTYTYKIEINDILQTEEYKFKSPFYFYENTPPPNVRIAILGSHYAVEKAFEPPYRILGDGYNIFNKIYDRKPDLNLWVGHTAHLRFSDKDSKSGYLKRYTKARSIIKPKGLLSEIPNLGILSDQDYGNSNTGGELSLKTDALESFKLFWPKSNMIKQQNALCYTYRISDAEFFFLDAQSQKSIINESEIIPKILGEEQIKWLKTALTTSHAKFKFIISGSPILNPVKSKKHLSYATKEHSELLEFFRNNQIEGLFFISGGSYKGELTKVVHSNSYYFYDLTVGPLTANPKPDKELNFFRVPGTLSLERQYTILEIFGEEEDRKLKISVYSQADIEIWSRIVSFEELSIEKAY